MNDCGGRIVSGQQSVSRSRSVAPVQRLAGKERVVECGGVSHSLVAEFLAGKSLDAERLGVAAVASIRDVLAESALVESPMVVARASGVGRDSVGGLEVARDELAVAARIFFDFPERWVEAKFTVASLDSLPFGLGARERLLLWRLFGGVVLPSDEIFAGVDAVDSLHHLNAKFKSAFGVRGVLLRTFDGRKSSGGRFYWLALNPGLFDCMERKPVAGVDFGLRDVFQKRPAKLARFLVGNDFSPCARVAKHLGVSAEKVMHAVQRLNEECESQGFPRAVESVCSGVRLYRLRREFSEFFRLKLKQAIRFYCFSSAQQELLLFLAERPSSTAEELSSHFEISIANVNALIQRVNKQAKFFGLEAVSLRNGNRFYYSVSEELAEAVEELACVAERAPARKFELSMFFSPKQSELVKLVASNPNLSYDEISVRVPVRRNHVSDLVAYVVHSCELAGLPAPFNPTGRANPLLSLTCEFAKLFPELEVAKPEASSFLSPAQRRVYDFFEKNPGSRVYAAVLELGIPHSVALDHVHNINAIFAEHGFSLLRVKWHKSEFSSFDAVRSRFLELRRELGRWPTQQILRRAGAHTLNRYLLKHGGINAVRVRVWSGLSESEREAIVRSDFERLRAGNKRSLSCFNGQRVTVEAALLAGLRAGADVPVLEKVIANSLKELEAELEYLAGFDSEHPPVRAAEERAALRVAEATVFMHEAFLSCSGRQ